MNFCPGFRVLAEIRLYLCWNLPSKAWQLLKEATLRILLDQGTPIALRHALSTHIVLTAYEQGWSSLTNGDLIKKAEAEFDVFITTDQNLYQQQNLTGLHLAILVLPFANWPKLRNYLAVIDRAVNSLKAGDYMELTLK